MFEYALKSFVYLMHLELIFEENFTVGSVVNFQACTVNTVN